MSASLHLASPYNVIQLNSRHTRQEKYFVRIKNVHKLFEAFILFMESFAILDVHCLLDLMLKYCWTLQEMETLFNNKYFSTFKSNQQFIFRITN